jgi:hypothetical protein
MSPNKNNNGDSYKNWNYKSTQLSQGGSRSSAQKNRNFNGAKLG